MSDNAQEIDPYASDAATLRPLIERIHRTSLRLRNFTFVSAAIPTFAVMATTVAGGSIPIDGALLTASLIAAATTQLSRWQKSRLRQDFETIWNNTRHETRPLLLGFLSETFDKKVGKTANLLGKEDFNVKDRTVVIGLGTTAVIATVYAPVAPIMFFTATQTREARDGAAIESAARHTLAYYDQISPKPTAP